MSFAFYEFRLSFGQHIYPPPEKGYVLGGDPVVDSFSEFGLCFESTVFQAMPHRPEHVAIGRSNIWAVHRVRQNFPFEVH